MNKLHTTLALAAGLGLSITVHAADKKGAVVYMANAGGGKFKEPKAAEIAAALQ